MTETVARPTRPSVMTLAIRERAALYAAYMPFIRGGGLFLPTARPYALGDDVYLILSVMEDPVKFPIAGKVIWTSPQGSQNGKPQGVGIQFPADETGENARKRIESVLGTAMGSSRPTHTL